MGSLEPTLEGKAPFKIASIDTPCFTYYKIFGELKNRRKPALVVLHGGPGAGHEYLLPFAEVFPRYGIPVVFYDHVGCGSSTHLRHTAGDKTIWRMDLFVDELDNLLDHLNLRDDPGYHLLGQSFGGRQCARYATRRPKGLQRLILANANASTELATQGADLARKNLPLQMQRELDEAEEKGEFESAAYKNALAEMTKRHSCRTTPLPEELQPAMKSLAEDRTVYSTVMGPSYITLTGTILGWTCIPDLPQITAPTLVYNGEYDSSADISNYPFFERIPRVRWITFSNAGHFCHVEGGGIRENVLRVVGDFLDEQN